MEIHTILPAAVKVCHAYTIMIVHQQNYVIASLTLATTYVMNNRAERMPFVLQKISTPFVNVPLASVEIRFQILVASQRALAMIVLHLLYVR